jgi:ceramide glucosyltransferase
LPDPAPVTLLKPLHLGEAELEENLRSFFAQEYEAPIQIIFGVRSYTDPALAVVDRLRWKFPEADVDVVIDSSFSGSNPKIANLINMLARAKHEILITSDSDIRVRPDYVHRIVAALDQPRVGAVTCLYAGRPVGNFWSVLEAMHIDFQFLPNAMFGIALGLTRPCFGATIALRRSTLEEIGGFESLSSHLADDYEIGRAVRNKGYRVEIPPLIVEHACSEQHPVSMLRRELRWSKTIRVLDSIGHLGSVITYPIPLALAALFALNFSEPAIGVFIAALAARTLLFLRVRGATGFRVGSLWLLPLRDMLSFVVFLGSFFGKSIYWRGTRYQMTPDGVLAQM